MNDANRLALVTELQGRYELLEKLGEGGFGTIYKARQITTGQTVAIKVLHLAKNATEAAQQRRLARFQREMQLCARVHHPNIVRLIDSGRAENGLVYTVFEFAPGKNLAQVLAEEGALELNQVRHLMIQLLDALACAHSLGVIHRDFKPANIMVVPTGARRNALVVDFGIGVLTEESANGARLTVTNESLGTPAYAAPEQLRGLPSTPRSDLYSWGLIFLECLTGQRVIEGATAAELIFQQLSPEPIPLPVALADHPLGHLLRRVTRKEAEARDVTAEGLLKELEALDLSGLESLSGSRERQPPQESEATASVQIAALQPPSPPFERLIEGERRQITALCCGLSISSTTGVSADPEELDQLLGVQQDVCAAIVRRFEGLMAGAMGDTVLFYFGYPTAREDDARRAAKAALEITAELARRSAVLEKGRQFRIKAQVGLHTGMVVARELRDWTQSYPGYVVGATPKNAARLCALVQPSTIAVSGETERLLRKHFTLKPLPPPSPDGAGAGMELFQLHEEDKPADFSDIPLVGRERELNVVMERWNQVCCGIGHGVLLSGEPGIGKSRLAREFQAKLDGQPHTWLESRCTPTSANSPFHPIIDLLERMLDPTREASTEVRLASLEAQLSRYGFDLAEAMPLFAPLLSLPLPERWPPLLELPANKKKELTRSAILSLLFEMAEQTPVVFLIEDLHWADPSTLELLNQLVGEVGSAPVLALFSARSEFTPPWPTTAVSLLQLGRLARSEIERMALRLTQDRPLPAEVLEQITLRTDGIPLFIEELLQTMSEAGTLVERDGRYVLAHPLSDVSIPATLRDLLVARLDRLGRAKETAQVASAIGREFTAELLRAISPLSEATLEEDLNKLVSSELVSRRRRLKSPAYLFKHALVRDAAYESMLKRSRQQVHARIAKAMEERFPESITERPELLAYHHAASEQKREAIGYAQKAALGALLRSACAEAISHARGALGWLDGHEDSRARGEAELGLNGILIPALMSSTGWRSPELKATADRSLELLGLLGDSPHAAPTLWVLALFYTLGGREYDKANTILEQLIGLSRKLENPGLEAATLPMLGFSSMRQANYRQAREQLERGLALHDPVKHQDHRFVFGQDTKVGGHVVLSHILWYMGYPDQAIEHGNTAIAWARQLNHATSLGLAYIYLTLLRCEQRDWEEVLRLADAHAELAQRHGLMEQVLVMTFFRACATRDVEVTRKMRALMEASGSEMKLSFYLRQLAQVETSTGAHEAALERVRAALRHDQEIGELYYQPALLRLEGSILLERDATATETAEDCFRRALTMAREQGGKMFELEAATSLAQLLSLRGRVDEARECLLSSLGWFTEGANTRQLTEARALLAQLGGTKTERLSG